MSEHGDQPHGGEEPRVVVRDRRRIDPETGQVRPPAEDEPSAGRHAAGTADTPSAAPATGPANGTPTAEEAEAASGRHELQTQLDERTADLQRLSAEYANYRRRVDRDREVAAANAKASLASELLTVLDDVDRAAAHGDLTGAFKAVADKLLATLNKAGLEPFGHEGEPFDPSVHEAVQHDTSPEVDGPTVTAVLRRGYRIGDRVVRAALVAVTDHEAAAGAPLADAQAAPADQQSPAGAAEST